MKTSAYVSVLALVALCTAATLRAETTAPSAELPVSRVAARTNANGDRVEVGASRLAVSLRLGSPSAVLADGTWLYYGYDATIANGRSVENRTLIVRFATQKVSALSLGDEATVIALRNLPKTSGKNQLLATNQR
jgi:outer membrane protein assembly factor BamE (lipoprotein component of BamABCDE complex)